MKTSIASFIIVLFCQPFNLQSQCCSAGGGGAGALSGNFAQGMSLKNQWDFNLNYQHTSTTKFMKGDSAISAADYHALAANNYLHGYNNNFLFGRLSYGVTDKLTLSVESGYYLNKTEEKRNYLVNTANSTGLSDLTIFPRYNVLHKKNPLSFTDVNVGMGIKLPVGSYNDSILVFSDTATGTDWYDIKSPAIQLSSGSNDFMFVTTASHRFILQQMTLLFSLFYINKGYNPDGGKFGDYLSASLFVTKTILPKLVGVAQFKGEFVGQKVNPPNYQFVSASDMAENSGSKKFIFSPSLSYSFDMGITLFAFTEIPLYQHLNGIQLASQTNFVAGISYRTTPKYKPEAAPAAIN